MNELTENQAFANGIIVGIGLYEQRIITTHARKEPMKVGDKLYFLQDGKERLEEVLNDICR